MRSFAQDFGADDLRNVGGCRLTPGQIDVFQIHDHIHAFDDPTKCRVLAIEKSGVGLVQNHELGSASVSAWGQHGQRAAHVVSNFGRAAFAADVVAGVSGAIAIGTAADGVLSRAYKVEAFIVVKLLADQRNEIGDGIGSMVFK